MKQINEVHQRTDPTLPQSPVTPVTMQNQNGASSRSCAGRMTGGTAWRLIIRSSTDLRARYLAE